MKVWNPIDNKKYETFSYLPALTDAQIAKQVDMIIRQGLSPCLEFSGEESSFVGNDNTVRFVGSAAGYYDNRYWTLWKLPMFGCTDASQVLHEVAECRRAYPDCYIRLAAFDSVKQVQVISFLVQKPGKVATWAVTGEKEMKVWNPIDNKKFETFSYLPLMTDAQIAKQVQMVIAKGLSPCLEFASEETSFVSNDNTVRFTGTAAGYYDNRYWTMWKLPMFGCTDASQVLNEVNECKKAYPDCYVRLAAFDSVKQVQVMSFVVQKPGQTAASSSTSYWAMAGTTGEKDMKVWTPIDNQKFETFSYLPPLSDGDIAKQVDFIIRNGLSPCLEFSSKETSTVSNDNTVRFTGTAAGYYDNRYWTMWKLPLFGCTDASQVLHEVAECRKAYPSCYIRLAAFDSVKQVQVISFLVHQPGATTAASSSTSYWAMAGTTGEKDMKVWNPIDNKKYETFSYLPELTDAQIAKQVQMMITNGLSPCLEFSAEESSFVSNDNTVRFTGSAAGYYDNRYWTLWKLPMFGCTDASQVLHEVNECRKAYPKCYIRLAAFDSVKQVQVMSFLVQKPGQSAASSSTSYWAMAGTTGEKDMKVWNPIDNKKYETFSYLPALTDAQIAKQVDMIIRQGLSPCLEFSGEESSFVGNDNTVRFVGSAAGYYDNRYWTLWKLPMFGCTDASQVLHEVAECRRAYPDCYIRLAAFDSVKQVQVISFLVQKPGKVATWAVTGEKEMKVWNPIDNKKFETFSYLPLMTDAQIAKQVQMVIAKGLSPCLEFASEETSFVSNDNTVRFTGTAAGYYDNRYWTMWKLPMFGCTDASQVLNEVNECKKAYPDCYVRLAAFDSVKQVQVMSFVVQKPGQTAASSSTSYWAMAGTTGEKDMKVWTPIDNQKFETFSYLPPLSDGDIAKQVDFIIRNGLSPCLEFSSKETSTVSNDNTVRFTGTAAGYYDNRYWTMWKLPLFGCTDASQVLHEVAECRKAYPSCYIRLAAFDSVKQVQVISFLVHQPGATTAASSSTSYWAMAGTTGEKDMKVWNPIDNKKYETFSYLPELTDAQIAKQVQMMITNGLSPCLEFSAEESSFVSNDNTVRFTGSAAGYYDNRYWTLWKLPMFGCTDASQVLHEVNECRKAYPKCYIRLAAFDSVKQVQVMSFLVQKPGQSAASSSTSYWAMAGTTGEKDMKVWNPIDNKKYETFSYLPALTDAQIAKQVDMIIRQGLSPCLEFSGEESSFVGNDNTVRFVGSAAGYYDNRYWTLWKLPMFGCTDASQVLHEVAECRRAYPDCYIRLAAFDSVKQVQVISFLVQKPGKVATWAVTGEKEMKVWNPIDNKKFETFSYLPLMTDAQIAKQVQMVIAKGLSPCLEFASEETSFVSNDNTVRFTGTAAGYYDNRYWTMWKLPMFGCTDASQVLNEVNECKKAYPDCYVRLAAFDSVKQVQVMSFVVQKPGQTAASSSTSYWAMAGTTGEKDMKVWTPIDNQKFETFSYLPPLSDGDIAKQVDFIIRNGLSPCLEFSSKETSTVSNDNTVRFTGTAAGYYDNRYWTMWKLPMFGCTDASQVLHEVAECRKAYPSCYIRLAAFDSVKQVQVISFLVHQPGATTAASSSTSYW